MSGRKTPATPLESLAYVAAGALRVRDRVRIREADRVLTVGSKPGRQVLSSTQGKKIARACGCTHPQRIEAGNVCGWHGQTVSGYTVVVVTRPVSR